MTVDAAPSFKTSKADFSLIKKIAFRAREMALGARPVSLVIDNTNHAEAGER